MSSRHHPTCWRKAQSVSDGPPEELGARLFCPGLHPLMSEENNEFIAAALDAAMAQVTEEG